MSIGVGSLTALRLLVPSADSWHSVSEQIGCPLIPGRKGGILPHSGSLQGKLVALETDDQGFSLIHPDPVITTPHRLTPRPRSRGVIQRLLRIAMASFIQNVYDIFSPYSNAETPQLVQAQAGNHPTTAVVEAPIYFYDSDKPYFESANCH